MDPDEVQLCVETIDVPMIPCPETVVIGPETDPVLAPPAREPVRVTPSFAPRYLVVLSTDYDDVPVGLFDHREEAVVFARDVYLNPDHYADRVRAMMRRARCRWVSLGVMEFAGPVPVRHTELFDLDN